jgi:hypothetical protein
VRLFRRRSGRHAAPRPEPPPAPATHPAEPRLAPPPTGPVQPYGQVRLGFSDGSAVTLSSDDPRVRAFRALAREIARRG